MRINVFISFLLLSGCTSLFSSANSPYIGKDHAFSIAANFLSENSDPKLKESIKKLDLTETSNFRLIKGGSQSERGGPVNVDHYRICFRYAGNGFNAWFNPADIFVIVDAKSGSVLRVGRDFHK